MGTVGRFTDTGDLVRAAESAAKSVILADGSKVTADYVRLALKSRQAASLG